MRTSPENVVITEGDRRNQNLSPPFTVGVTRAVMRPRVLRVGPRSQVNTVPRSAKEFQAATTPPCGPFHTPFATPPGVGPAIASHFPSCQRYRGLWPDPVAQMVPAESSATELIFVRSTCVAWPAAGRARPKELAQSSRAAAARKRFPHRLNDWSEFRRMQRSGCNGSRGLSFTTCNAPCR